MERRSELHRAYFRVKPGTEVTKDLLARRLAVYLERKGKDGWQYEKLLRYYRTEGLVVTEKGDEMEEWNFDILISRPQRLVTLELPDKVALAVVRAHPTWKIVD